MEEAKVKKEARGEANGEMEATRRAGRTHYWPLGGHGGRGAGETETRADGALGGDGAEAQGVAAAIASVAEQLVVAGAAGVAEDEGEGGDACRRRRTLALELRRPRRRLCAMAHGREKGVMT